MSATTATPAPTPRDTNVSHQKQPKPLINPIGQLYGSIEEAHAGARAYNPFIECVIQQISNSAFTIVSFTDGLETKVILKPGCEPINVSSHVMVVSTPGVEYQQHGMNVKCINTTSDIEKEVHESWLERNDDKIAIYHSDATVVAGEVITTVKYRGDADDLILSMDEKYEIAMDKARAMENPDQIVMYDRDNTNYVVVDAQMQYDMHGPDERYYIFFQDSVNYREWAEMYKLHVVIDHDNCCDMSNGNVHIVYTLHDHRDLILSMEEKFEIAMDKARAMEIPDQIVMYDRDNTNYVVVDAQMQYDMRGPNERYYIFFQESVNYREWAEMYKLYVIIDDKNCCDMSNDNVHIVYTLHDPSI
jgi:hypothetical protein